MKHDWIKLSLPDTKQGAAIRDAGLEVWAKFVPWSEVPAGDRWENERADKVRTKAIHWRVQLRDAMRADRAKPLAESRYAAGQGHLPYVKANGGQIATLSVIDAEAIEHEIELGRTFNAYHKPIFPDAADVVYSLVTDCDVSQSGGFEDWAAEFGYDPDSRKAEAIYRQCLEIYIALVAGIGAGKLERLRDAFTGY